MENSLHEFAKLLLQKAGEYGISPAQVKYSEEEAFSVRMRKGSIEDVESKCYRSVQLRGKVHGKIGSASTSALDEDSIHLLIQGVCESALLIEKEDQDEILPPDEAYEEVVTYDPELEKFSMEDAMELTRRLDAAIADNPPGLRPDDTGVGIQSSNKGMMNTLGLDLSQRRNGIIGYVSMIGQEGEASATQAEIAIGHQTRDIDPAMLAGDCRSELLRKLHAVIPASGVYPVVLHGKVASSMLSVFSGIFSAESVDKGLSLLKGREGEQIASRCVTVMDDPFLPWKTGTTAFDEEGSATRKKEVISEGVLSTLLYNRRTAKKAGRCTTGNSMGEGLAGPTNLYIREGQRSLEEIMSGVKDGILVTEVSGLHAGANLISGDFSLLARGYRIRDGRQEEAVEQFTIAGNFYQTLRDIEEVGNDLKFRVSNIASPSLLISGMSVAGRGEN